MIAGAASAGTTFASGLVLPLRAARLILRVPSLRRWSIAAVVVSAVVLAGIAVGLALVVDDLLALVWRQPAGAARFAWWLLYALAYGVLFVIAAAAVPPIATAPLGDPLSAATERALGRVPPAGRGLLRETVSSVLRTAARVAILLAGQGAILLLWLLPGAGAAIATALSIAWTSAWLAVEYLDVPGNRHGLGFGASVRLARDHLPAAMGFGLGVYALLWIPLLNVVFIPVAVVGGTMLFARVAERR